MRLKTIAALTTLALSIPVAAGAAPVDYDGITFPGGNASFADNLVSLEFGDPAPTDPDYRDGTAALGSPDYSGGTGSVSLGVGGTIVVQFTDNSLSGSDSDAADLHIFEIGPQVEDTNVWISIDGLNFIDVGSVSGATSSIDIDPYLADASLDPFTQFSYVRLQDVAALDGQSGSTVGADIDAIGAISSAPPVAQPVPEPGGLAMFGLGLLGLALGRRRRKT